MPKFTKVCTVCSEVKDSLEFYKLKASPDGFAYRCKVCDNLASTTYRQNNRVRHLGLQRVRNRKSKYGLTEGQFQSMKLDQDMKCKICEVKLEESGTNKHTSKTLCVDHDHNTGAIRGLLCTKCNKGLGLFNDSHKLLKVAVDYLKRNYEYK